MAGLHIYRQMGGLLRLARRAYRPYRGSIILLTVLGFVSGILEGIGINAIIPLLTFVLGLQNPATDALSQAIKTFFDFIHVPFVPRYLLLFIVVLFIAKAAVSLLLSYVQVRITTAYERETRSRLFSKVLSASWPYLLRQRLGNLETLLMVDTPAAMSILVKLSFCITLFTGLLMYLVVAFSISSFVTLTTFMLGILVFVFLRPILDRVHLLSKERTNLYRDTMHHVTEHVGGLKTVKALGVESAAIEKGESLFDRIREQGMKIQLRQQFAIQAVTPIGVLYIAAILSMAFKTEFISFAALPAILYLIYRIFTYVQQLQNTVQYLSELTPHLERVIQFESAASEKVEPDRGEKPFVFKKSLSFKNLSFAYESGKEVLHNVSFDIEKGTMLGLVGPSGAGKTTSVDLMLRLLEPTQGAIELDGVDAREIKLSDWRQKIAYVSQDLFILQDTIGNNIRFYDNSITDEEIWKAAKMARIDGFIEKSPEGLDTMIGDRGITISAGERQRLVIARALVRKPELLILDEATSALDNESEAHIKKVIESLKGKITIVAIAHRLTTIMDSDKLVVLHEGKVMEEGSPHRLLSDINSYFYKVSMINQ